MNSDTQITQPAPRRKRWPIVLAAGVSLLVGVGIGTAAGASGEATPVAAPAPITKTVQAPPETVTETVTEQAPAPVDSGPDASAVTAGTYAVGSDIPAGRYTTDGPASGMCYWQRTTDDSGEFDSIITNAVVQGPSSVTINAGEFVTFNGSCAWTHKS